MRFLYKYIRFGFVYCVFHVLSFISHASARLSPAIIAGHGMGVGSGSFGVRVFEVVYREWEFGVGVLKVGHI